MKQKVSLPVAIGALALVLGIAAFAWFRLAGSPQGSASGGPPPLPASVGAELQKIQPGVGRTAPSGPTGPTPMMGGGMSAPPGMTGAISAPPGLPGGMTAPPTPGR